MSLHILLHYVHLDLDVAFQVRTTLEVSLHILLHYVHLDLDVAFQVRIVRSTCSMCGLLQLFVKRSCTDEIDG